MNTSQGEVEVRGESSRTLLIDRLLVPIVIEYIWSDKSKLPATDVSDFPVESRCFSPKTYDADETCFRQKKVLRSVHKPRDKSQVSRTNLKASDEGRGNILEILRSR